jgi:RNA polymerase sigma factor (sigma-70 family)
MGVEMEESDFESERKKLVRSLRVRFSKKIDLVDIETAVSEGFEAFFQAAKNGTLAPDESPYGYTHESAYHAILKLLRRRAHERPISEMTEEPDAHDPEERRLEAKDMVHEIFEHLSGDYQKVLIFHIEGYFIEEISEKMNRSLPATYKLLERAKKRFYEKGINLGIPPLPPAIVVPTRIKIK